jgi:hypothetical protein
MSWRGPSLLRKLVRAGNPQILAGAIGFMALDVAALAKSTTPR